MVLDQLLVGALELLGLLHLLHLAFMLLLALFLQVLLDLALDELALEHLVLDALDHAHLEGVQLVVDDLLVLHLLLVFLEQLLAYLVIILLHLHLLQLFPLLLDLLFQLALALPQLQLRFPLLEGVAHQQLAVEGLDLVLGVVHRLVRPLYRLLPCLHGDLVLKGVDLAPLQLFLLETADALVVALLAEGFDGVGPVLHARLGLVLESEAVFGLQILFVLA